MLYLFKSSQVFISSQKYFICKAKFFLGIIAFLIYIHLQVCWMAVGLVDTFYGRFSLIVCVRARGRMLVAEMFILIMVMLFLVGFRFSFLVRDFVPNEMSSMVIEIFRYFIFFIKFHWFFSRKKCSLIVLVLTKW